MGRQPLVLPGARGFAYAELDDELSAHLPRWLASGEVDDGIALKPGRVYRWRDRVVKFFAPEPAPWRWLRASPAVREADAHLGMPVPVPAPRCALTGTRGILITDWVAGTPLREAWSESPAARAALPGFLAALHRARVHHGDLHPGNVLFDGRDLVLLDLAALRRGLHLLFEEKLVRAEWSSLLIHLGDEAGLARAFQSYSERVGRSAESECRWKGVRIAAQRKLRRRAHPPGAGSAERGP
jgi:tRNA A-37 threonylcarbamoyl transferase component Bud32